MTRVITQSEEEEEERSRTVKQYILLQGLVLLPLALACLLLIGYGLIYHQPPSSTTYDRSNFNVEEEAAIHLWHMVLAFVCVLCLGYIASVIVEWYDDDRKEKSGKNKRETMPLRRSERIAGMKMGKVRWRYILEEFA